jgi:riboflavin synthase
MFTGIVQGTARIKSIESKQNLNKLTVIFPNSSLKNLNRGASIALNGCCLTVTEFDTDASIACFDVMQESLRATNLGGLQEGSIVNFERAAKIGDEIGGHLMSGHITTTITLVDRKETETNCELVFSCADDLRPYILPKGFVGLNGCSLTIGSNVRDTFSVHLIPETLEVTTFGQLECGAKVNIEIDPSTQAIVDTVERYLERRRECQN